LFDMPAKESDSRLPRQHFSPETAQSSQYTAPPRIRDCERFRVVKFNAHGPDGLLDRKSPGQPSGLNDTHRAALAEIIESGPIPAI
jgi:hypothetical protein